MEDRAEAHGVDFGDYIPDAACWSFYRNKIVAGEEGGAIAFKNPRHASVAKSLRSLGFTTSHDFYHVPRGHNYRLANCLAQLVLSSLANVDANLAKRRQLEEARQDFELALQELATPVDKKKKKPKLAVDPEVLQLAANCQKLASGQTQMGYLKSMLPVVAGLLASGGAYMGYSNYQGKSKRNALDYAERKANMAREAQNPTFMSASLIDAPKEDEQPEDAARQQLLDMLEQEYPYLP
mgnify:CR=1 FL=1